MDNVYAFWMKKKSAPLQSEQVELKNARILSFLMQAIIIVNFVFPPYLGVHIGFDFTVIRVLNILVLAYFVMNREAGNHFAKTIWKCKLTPFILAFLFVTWYTGGLRVSVNTIVNSTLEFLTFYMILYGARYVIGIGKTLKLSVGCAWFLGIYGMLEYACRESLMLKFLSTMYTPIKNNYRSGQYRVMGPCAHSIGYGLLLEILVVIICIDYEKKQMNLLKRPILLGLLVVNSFITGSRAALGFVAVECLIIFLFSNREVKKKTLFFATIVLLVAVIGIVAIYNTSLGQYIMMQICSVIDSAFGTSLAGYYGADTLWLEQSTSYRDVLPKIFTLDWMNPLIGKGLNNFWGCEIDGVFIRSIDNYYVMLFINYAYPGLITHVGFVISAVWMMFRTAIKEHAEICYALAIGILCYFVNLWFVDSLMTLKYAYAAIAIYYAYYLTLKQNDNGLQVLGISGQSSKV